MAHECHYSLWLELVPCSTWREALAGLWLGFMRSYIELGVELSAGEAGRREARAK